MEIKLYKGRPNEEREPREMAAYDFLDSLGIEYTRADHERADTMEACKEIDEALGFEICKNLFLCNVERKQTLSAALLDMLNQPRK